MKKLIPDLEEIELSVSNVCNLRCRHCSAANDKCRTIHELSLSEIQRVLEDAKFLGAARVDITGGEPTLRKDLCQIIESAKKCGFWVKLLSNGTLLNQEKLQELKNSGLDGLAVSLDGASAEVHSRTRQTSEKDFEKVVSNIKSAIQLGIATKINTAVSRVNLREIVKIAQMAKELGCFEHRICLFMPVGRGKNWQEQILDSDTWQKFVFEKLTHFPRGSLKIGIAFDYLPPMLQGQCETECVLKNASTLKRLPVIYISHNGNVYPCIMFSFNRFPIGNIKQKSLMEIWHNPKTWQDIQDSVAKICPRQDCKNNVFVCPYRKIYLDELEKKT